MRTLLFVALLVLGTSARAAVETFYLGTYTTRTASQGIYSSTLDTTTGALSPLKVAAAVGEDPTFLALSPDGHVLFAALSDGVASFRVGSDGILSPISHQPAGPNTCHLTLDRSGRELFSASYDAGSIWAYPVDPDGRIGACTDQVVFQGSGPNVERQKTPHAHSVYVDPENRFLYACDLGSDRIWIFRLAPGGKLVPADPPAAVTSPGSGPRHLAFGAGGRRVYVANELGVSTSVYSRDNETGALKWISTQDNIPPGWPKGTGSAEIEVHPSGKWLYVSTRLIDAMTVFRVSAAGSVNHGEQLLEREQVLPCPVKFPRSFAIDPSGRWIVVAGQTDNRIAVLKIDPVSGQLAAAGQPINAPCAVCVLFEPVR